MVGKRVQFDDETWEAIEAVMHDRGSSFQELADEAFSDLLKKHKQPVGRWLRSRRAWARGTRAAVGVNQTLIAYSRRSATDDRVCGL